MSKLIADFFEGVELTGIVETIDSSITSLPIKNEYSRALIGYGFYMHPDIVTKYLTETDEITRMKIRQMIFNQYRIYEKIASESTNRSYLVSVNGLYTQLGLASYLEDKGYFEYIMEEVYRRWRESWSRLVTGSIPELNYDIYTFTPWLYLPADLVNNRGFIIDWRANMVVPNSAKTIHINDVYHTVSNCDPNDPRLKYSNINPKEFYIMSSIAWGDNELITMIVTLYPDRSRIKYEEIKFMEHYDQITKILTGEGDGNSGVLSDRIGQMISMALTVGQSRMPLGINTYWDDEGRIIKQEYYYYKPEYSYLYNVSGIVYVKEGFRTYEIVTYYP